MLPYDVHSSVLLEVDVTVQCPGGVKSMSQSLQGPRGSRHSDPQSPRTSYFWVPKASRSVTFPQVPENTRANQQGPSICMDPPLQGSGRGQAGPYPRFTLPSPGACPVLSCLFLGICLWLSPPHFLVPCCTPPSPLSCLSLFNPSCVDPEEAQILAFSKNLSRSLGLFFLSKLLVDVLCNKLLNHLLKTNKKPPKHISCLFLCSFSC